MKFTFALINLFKFFSELFQIACLSDGHHKKPNAHEPACVHVTGPAPKSEDNFTLHVVVLFPSLVSASLRAVHSVNAAWTRQPSPDEVQTVRAILVNALLHREYHVVVAHVQWLTWLNVAGGNYVTSQSKFGWITVYVESARGFWALRGSITQERFCVKQKVNVKFNKLREFLLSINFFNVILKLYNLN